MYLLVKEPSIVMLLISGIGGLVAAIVWLALYIRKLHNKMEERSLKYEQNMVEVVEKCTEAISTVTHSVEANTKSSDKTAEAIDDLHKFIIKNMSSGR